MIRHFRTLLDEESITQECPDFQRFTIHNREYATGTTSEETFVLFYFFPGADWAIGRMHFANLQERDPFINRIEQTFDQKATANLTVSNVQDDLLKEITKETIFAGSDFNDDLVYRFFQVVQRVGQSIFILKEIDSIPCLYPNPDGTYPLEPVPGCFTENTGTYRVTIQFEQEQPIIYFPFKMTAVPLQTENATL